MIGNDHEKDLFSLLETLKDTVSYEFIDLWTEVRDWSVRPVWRLRTASKQICLISHKKPISQLQARMNVERLFVYINPVLRNVTICVLNYGYGTTSVGSR